MCFEVLLDAVEATNMPLKHDQLPLKKKRNDLYLNQESNAQWSSNDMTFS